MTSFLLAIYYKEIIGVDWISDFRISDLVTRRISRILFNVVFRKTSFLFLTNCFSTCNGSYTFFLANSDWVEFENATGGLFYEGFLFWTIHCYLGFPFVNQLEINLI